MLYLHKIYAAKLEFELATLRYAVRHVAWHHAVSFTFLI